MEKLKQALNVRLQNIGKVKSKDEFGKDVLIEDKVIFSDKELTAALETSMSALNQFHIVSECMNANAQESTLHYYQDIIVQGAVIQLLGGQMLLEKGREFGFQDAGVAFQPPHLADTIMQQWTFEYQMYMQKLKMLIDINKK